MILCPRCGAGNREGRHFCAECGAPLALACAACGFTNEPGEKFCGGCGALLVTTTASVPFGAPSAYTPRHLAEKILTSRGALEGERKQVTVLFADLKGSLELLAERDPEEARRILDPVLERMMEAVHRYEGTVNQVMGDGIMALFGAPLAHEDHAVRACYAALRMQETVKRYARGVPPGSPSIQIRVGVNSGEVVVRSIGSDLRMDYSAIGQTTHLAARMEQLAAPGSILITPGTLALVEGHVRVTPLGPRAVKGLAVPIETYEVVGAGAARTRFEVAAARGLSRFVGREDEMAQLRQALDRGRVGSGQLVAVVGEPGVGKSRLFWEFTHSADADGWLILVSRSVSYGKATSYLPIVELLRAYFRLESADGPVAVRDKVTAKLHGLDRQLAPWLTPVLWLLDVPIADEGWERLDPPQRRQRILDGVKRILLRESQVQSVMVLFEDLHWIDAETQSFLDSLVESLPGARLLLLVNYRPEYRHDWGSKTYYRQLQVDPLPPERAGELLETLLGTDANVAPLQRVLIERTEGNPFFLEESVRALVETGVLAGERGAYRLARAPETVQIPAATQAILAARIDRLSPADKRLLQAATVIGKDVPFALLHAIAGEEGEVVRLGLARLQAAEFLYEARLFPDVEYTFKHALTHEVAYGSLLQDRRRVLHARIVEAIERLSADRLGEQVERLAHHALRGELWEKAVSYLRQAGARAVTRSAYREAAVCFEQALESLARLPETQETRELAIDLRFDLRTALWPVGELATVLEQLRAAERLASAIDDRRRLGWASAYLSLYFWVVGRPIEARPFAERARHIAEALGDSSLGVAAALYLGLAWLAAGHPGPAATFLGQSMDLVGGDLSRERFGMVPFPAAVVPSFLALALAEAGRFEEGVIRGREGLRVAEALAHPYSLVMAASNLGGLYLAMGDFDRATPLLERALEVSREADMPLNTLYVMTFLGYAHALSGRVEEAFAMGLQLLSVAATVGVQTHSALPLVRLGQISLLAGRPDPALAFAEQALTLAREVGQRGGEAWALCLLGEIAAQSEDAPAETAADRFREAMALATDLGMRPLVAHCHHGLGKLYRRAGKRHDAREHLTTAAALYREMGMHHWLEQVEREMGS